MDNKKVFVVHGRNEQIKGAIFNFLRAIGLEPIEWGEARAMTGKASPYIGEILNVAFTNAWAIIVLLTPDDEAKLKEEFLSSGDGDEERNYTPQPRPNVIFEAGMAMGFKEDRTVLVEFGKMRGFSDIHGRNTIRLTNDAKSRQNLVSTLKTIGLAVNIDGKTDYLTTGDFTVITHNASSDTRKSVSLDKVIPSDDAYKLKAYEFICINNPASTIEISEHLGLSLDKTKEVMLKLYKVDKKIDTYIAYDGTEDECEWFRVK